ncbi:S8 family peptidase [Micromonospora okii]|uniref:S8 family peptidase n=1 Tax=Micromonospora okii TaxID=1182970 RepID=UPI001E3D9189|nr:S8 family serine peptidase [Micromonospora okii]
MFAARLTRALAAAATGTALVLSATQPVLAAPATPDGPPPPNTPSAPQPEPGEIGTHRVPLLTGDTVTVTTGRDGRSTYSVDTADDPTRSATFTVTGSDDDLFVIPSDAEPYVTSGLLERDLFNVRELVRQGITDAAKSVPVIVTFQGDPAPKTLARQADALPASANERTLASIDGAALSVSTADARQFWDSLAPATTNGTARAALSKGVKKVWLDRKFKVNLAQSVPQVGAPAAWAAGVTGTGVKVAVIDTGIDPAHPDLSGNIAGIANFTPEADGVDYHGHGTHVASTVAGSGAASGGRHKGVAPGAQVLSAKALDRSGSGQDSWIIASMEWATAQGADVVNMSLSAPNTTDGTDPMSQAVDSLTASTGALFVVAAGNNYGDLAIGSPSAASSALTVGAVDKADALAPYSNRGPRYGDAAVKPEITAPGTDIVAARAAGSPWPAVEGQYTRVSGTSMATPHVAGAAALLAQANPDWTATQLKDALVTSTKAGAYAWWQGGTGRLDVPRALQQRVYGTATVNVGRIAGASAPIERKVTYTNSGAAPVTLGLALDVKAFDGKPMPAGSAALSATSVVVPAKGTAQVTLTVDPKAVPTGGYGGMLLAKTADGSVSVRTGVSWYKETATQPVTVRLIDSKGDAPRPQTVGAIRIDNPVDNDPMTRPAYYEQSRDGVVTMQLPVGVYDIQVALMEHEEDVKRATLMTETEVRVDGPTTVTLDARKAVNVRPPTAEPTDMPSVTFGTLRGLADNSVLPFSVLIGGSQYEGYATPTKPVKYGFLEFQNQWTLAESLVDLRLRGGGRLAPDYDLLSASSHLNGKKRSLPVAFAGSGSPKELAAAGVKGKAALIRIQIPADMEWPWRHAHAQNEARAARDAAAAAGAATALIYVDVAGAPALLGSLVPSTDTMLALTLSRAEGESLRKGGKKTTVTLDGNPGPSYVYHLRRDHNGVPKTPERPVNPKAMVKLNTSYHADKPHMIDSIWGSLGPRDPWSAQSTWRFPGPTARTEYVGEGDHQWLRYIVQVGTTESGAQEQFWWTSEDYFRAGTPSRNESWFAAPLRVGALEVTSPVVRANTCGFCRDGDIFLAGQYWVDGNAGHSMPASTANSTWKLTRNGVVIPPLASSPRRFQLPAGSGVYRLETTDTGYGLTSVRTLAPRVDSVYTFRSETPAKGAPAGYACPSGTGPCAFQPVLQLDYDLGLDLNNKAKAGWAHKFTITAAAHGSTPGKPKAKGMSVSTSTDGGATWHRALVVPNGGGRFNVYTLHPKLSRTDGFVWLKVNAWDANGNRTEQTVQRAYGLR